MEAWQWPDVAAVEIQAGRAEPFPDWIEVMGLAKRFGVAPWEVGSIPQVWVMRARVMDEAERRYDEIRQRENARR